MTHAMGKNRIDRQAVTLLLHDQDGESWRLTLSADCLCFIGNYRRVKGFEIDAMVAFDGVQKKG